MLKKIDEWLHKKHYKNNQILKFAAKWNFL